MDKSKENSSSLTHATFIDERRIFQDAVRDVAPLIDRRKVAPVSKRHQPLPLQSLRDEQQALAQTLELDPSEWDPALENGDDLSYVSQGLSRQILRKLRRGHWVVQDQLDLHGLTRDQARESVSTFLNHCAKHGYRCVRIIHGKGLGSLNREPVLKRKVGFWLAQRADVLAFSQARPTDGGGGAVIVLLKARSLA